MEIDIEVIREKISEGRYAISFTHTEKLRRRRIKAQDIEETVKTGSIIEEYPDDPRGGQLFNFWVDWRETFARTMRSIGC